MKKRPIYLVFDCDEWKYRSSMRLAMATTSPKRLRSFIAGKIERGDFIYGGEEDSIRQQVMSFKKDFDEQPKGSINAMLTYGFFDCVYDGEEA